MKVLGAYVLLLLCTVTLFAIKVAGNYSPSDCCKNYYPSPDILSRVSGYDKTSGTCSKPGVVFHTILGRKICVNPNETWVQKYINSKERNSVFSGGQ
ncbi:C-C motif chemokine 3-like [Saccopteryx leptura]|uniref:C-C motif chemokine 3-like n=1 Tax=Saccopteryx leptura TaxID=249018 RepID=UPI00339C6783